MTVLSMHVSMHGRSIRHSKVAWLSMRTQICRECEQYGMASSKLLEFNTPEEAEEVEEIFNNAIQCLSEEDRALGPVTRMLPMLKKVGKGSHWEFIM